MAAIIAPTTAAEIAQRAPLEDCTRVTLHESNVVRSGKPSENAAAASSSKPTLKRAASYDGTTPLRRTHNPYVNVIPEDPEQALLDIQAQQFAQLAMEQHQRRYSAAMAAAAAAATVPVTPTTPYFTSGYMQAQASFSSALFDEVAAMSASMPTSPLMAMAAPAPQLTVGGRVPTAAVVSSSSTPSSPAFRVPSAALTKVYQNGRPVPTLKRVASVEHVAAPAPASPTVAQMAPAPSSFSPVSLPMSMPPQQLPLQIATPPRVHQHHAAAPSSATEAVIATPCTVTVQFRHPSHVARFNLSSPQKVLKVDTRAEMLGMYVVVDGDRGYDLGCIVAVDVRTEAPATPAASPSGNKRHGRHAADEHAVPDAQIQRPATAEEITRFETAQPVDEQRALHFASTQAAKLLPEKLCIEAVTFQFDRQKLTLWYRAPERVYFVPLLKVLNQQYKCRIWMEKLGE